jgi:hypothetical protein
MAVDDHLTCGVCPLGITLLVHDNASGYAISVWETFPVESFTDRKMVRLDFGERKWTVAILLILAAVAV